MPSLNDSLRTVIKQTCLHGSFKLEDKNSQDLKESYSLKTDNVDYSRIRDGRTAQLGINMQLLKTLEDLLLNYSVKIQIKFGLSNTNLQKGKWALKRESQVASLERVVGVKTAWFGIYNEA
ncbi:unnamed protein product [Dovyalis caffra]|uniref:Uncharacterized protein n=1 Tax=Dovyalis caffra TaxID=77055 RepID=A0AAV1RI80_9ROSI|nr:unnamed protein product [Dovyalis caffra]